MLSAAVTANFDAVALLRCGRNRQAAAALKGALQHLATAFPQGEEDERKSHHEHGETWNDFVVRPSGIFTVPIDMAMFDGFSDAIAKSPAGKPNVASEDVFTGAFVLPPSAQRGRTGFSSCSSDQCAAECAAVCLYNMGLTLHLESLCSSNTTAADDLGSKALQLYLRAYKVAADCSLARSDPLVLLLMAASVNVASIFMERGDLREAEKWRNTFRSTFGWSTVRAPQGTTGVEMLTWEPQDLAFFSICAVLFENQKLSSAAAA